MEDKEYFKRNVQLYIANEEPLYKLALGVTDFKLNNNQISNLTVATVRAIVRDGGNITMPGYESIEALKPTVVEEVKSLQEAARS